MQRAVATRGGWGRGVVALAVLWLAWTNPNAASAQTTAVKGTAAISAQAGFARVIIKLDDDVDMEAMTTGNVIVVRFKRPVDLALENFDTAAPDYVGAVRRDPDNMAVRFALRRKVTLNTMIAGERTFVDLLPDDWKGPPPGLPADVVRELAERARAAERTLREQRKAANPVRERPIVRVRASQQPTFLRYVFEKPEDVTGSAKLNGKKLTIAFDAPLTFDLADAQIVSPASIGAIAQRADGSSSAVEINLIGDAELRAFHEDAAYVVDLVALASDPLSKVERMAAQIAPPAAKARDESKVPAGDIAAASSTAIAAALKKDPPDAVKPIDVPPPAASSQAAPRPAAETKVEAKRSAAVVATPPQTLPAAAAPAPPPAPSAAMASPARAEAPPATLLDSDVASGKTKAETTRTSDGLRILIPLSNAAPAALFRRADAYWFVLDSNTPIDTASIKRDGGALIGDVRVIPLDRGQAVRIRLNRPQLASLAVAESGGQEAGWTLTFSDTAPSLPRPLDAVRNIAEPSRATVAIPMQGVGFLHKMTDPEAGDALQVVTASAPARGIMRRQDFVEFSLLETVHGVVIQANADDLKVEALPERITLGRPGGLTLSAALGGISRATSAVKPLFDLHEWQENQRGPFSERLAELTAALARAPENARAAARNDLVQFYFARGFYPEAKAMLDQMLNDKAEADDPVPLILHAVAATMMGRPEVALKDLGSPALGTNYDSQLWRAMALAQQGKWPEARERFKNAGFAGNTLPFEIQRVALMQAITSSIEVKDFANAASKMSELELVGIPENIKPAVAVLRGRIEEALARDGEALADYKSAAQSSNRQAAAEGRLREIAMRINRDDIPDEEAVRELETISMTWRGDATEMKALQLLTKLYTKASRYPDALAAARTATALQPNSEIARQLQDEAAETFTQMYLSPKGDGIPPIEALATFYENRDLTPIGRRGDELIRRLSDRLVAVDLLDQAGEVLQYQVDNRLEGAARAQVAARLATVYLMNRKPDRAIAALRSTRIADLAGELRAQRLLLEARAQSDIGRRDLALDIISNLGGREAVRLRSDIHWAARRWREAAEQIELYLGDRYKDFAPLEAAEKSDVMRAVIGYALAEDSLGLARFREKYAPLLTSPVDRTMFDIASKPASATGAEFAQVAKMAASVDTLDGFLRDMKVRFPDATARAKQLAQPETTGALTKIESRRAEAAR